MNKEDEPRELIGKNVRVHLLLEGMDDPPRGKIVGVLSNVGSSRGVLYLVALERDYTFEPHRKGILLRRKSEVTVRYLILHLRNPDEIEEELHGKVSSELTAPLLFFSTKESLLPPDELGSQGDLQAVGPVRVLLE